MNRNTLPTFFDHPLLNRVAIGLDPMFAHLERQVRAAEQGYPPYNVLKISDDRFVVEVAVAGFTPDEITMTVEDRVLTISGSSVSDVAGEIIHKGISNRDFTRTFTLADHVEVTSAVIKNGILSVDLSRVVPEALKPKSIPITAG